MDDQELTAIIEAAKEEVQEEVQEEQHQETPEVEEKALKMGWVPKEQFKGDPDNWRPAEEFVERGENMIPIMRKKIRDLEKRQEDKDKAFNDYLQSLRDKLHAQKVEEHEARKRQAVEEGDSETYDRLSRETPVNDIPEYTPPTPATDPVFDDWKAENDWYVTDYEKHQEAENYGRFLKETNPQLSGREFLDEVSKHVRQKYQNPNRQKAPSFDGGTPKASSNSGKLYDSLDADAKAQFNKFVRDGIFTNTAESREAFAQDVLS